ncbi:MAG: Holliday junction branch migration protein RuvA [Gammaproteobacteria bacterium]|nr:Holliday junction branch migration protein RuvA [Gammaproteobacteria bacterium]
MIGRLQGTLLARRPPHLLVDVRGVGYEVEAPMSTFYALPATGATVTLHTHLAVREDAHVLYGFSTETERTLFRALIRVSGVGGRLALAILSGISAEAFVRCVRDHDAAALTRLPGVGKKTAERLIVEMRDRLEDWEGAIPASAAAPAGEHATGPLGEAVSALVALGYKANEASRMVRAVEGGAALSSEELIRRALQTAVRS